jgi:hypothetical protein
LTPCPDSPGAGEELVLVAAVVARNDARVLVTASLHLLSNAAMRAPPAPAAAAATSNEALAAGLVRWLLHEEGVMRLDGELRHWSDTATEVCTGGAKAFETTPNTVTKVKITGKRPPSSIDCLHIRCLALQGEGCDAIRVAESSAATSSAGMPTRTLSPRGAAD